MKHDDEKTNPPSVSDAMSKIAAFVGASCVDIVAGFFVLIASKSLSLALMAFGGIVALGIGLAGYKR